MSIDIEKAILIVGGYGVVGSQVARLFRQRHPAIPILLGGRNPASASKLIDEIDNAEAIKLDVTVDKPLTTLDANPIVILNVVNDSDNTLLIDSINRSIAYIDVTRWTEKMREAIDCASTKNLQGPVVLSSGWMAGVTALIAAAASQRFSIINSIDIDILYGMGDKSGPNSIEYIDRMAVPFEIVLEGEKQQRYPFSDPKTVKFPSGYKGKVYRFDTPDQMTLPTSLKAKSVSSRIGYDSALITGSLAFLIKSGVMKLLDRPIFDGIRRGLLYSSGEGASHEIVIEIIGTDSAGKPKVSVVSIVDPKGQTHLTALGAVIQLERVLALNDQQALTTDIHFPEQNTQFSAALSLLDDNGVKINGLEANGQSPM